MAMEIILSAEIHPIENGSCIIPQAPPLPPSLLCKIPAAASEELHSDSDSGHGDSVMALSDILPGLELSDWEFNEEFSSAASSRRPSASGGIPLPPPPPSLPSYLSNSTPNIAMQAPKPAHLPSEIQQILLTEQDIHERSYLDEYDAHFMYHDDPRAEPIQQTCIVCYNEVTDFITNTTQRKCCKEFVCQECIFAIVHTNIEEEGRVFISCPNPSCDGAIERTEILSHITGKTKEKFDRLRAEAEASNTKKACPNCSHLIEHQLPKRFRKYKDQDVQITCEKCSFVWCFACHAPWHTDLSCKEFKKGNKDFRKWTSSRSTRGIANCQKCPLCRVYIQRSTGCDHMTCNRCDTHFCYKCGGRFGGIIGLGDHYDETSVFGCKYNYLKDEPIKRKTVRGGYLGSKLAALTGYPVLFIAGAAVVVVVGAVALPIYGGYRYYKYRKNMKTRYWNRRK